MENLNEKCSQVLNRLAKWRGIFAGWQLGTRSKEDPECQAVRDHREATLLLRAELSAFTALALRKGLFSPDEFHRQLIDEAEALDHELSRRFPGITSSDHGMVLDSRAVETMKGWKP